MAKKKSPKFNFLPIIIGLIIAIIGLGGGYLLYGLKDTVTVNENESLVTEIKDKGSFAGILFGKDEYTLSYSDLPAETVEIVSNFEPGDEWTGTGFWDKRVFIQGEASLAVNSIDGENAIISLDFPEGKDLSSTKFINFYINFSDIQLLQRSELKLGDTNLDNYYVYNLTNLKTGWNAIQIPVKQMVKISTDSEFNLSAINKIQFEFQARPNNSVVANFDRLTFINSDGYLPDWQANSNDVVSLATMNNQIVFEARKTSNFMANLAKAGSSKDFIYEARVSPQTRSAAGLFFRGSAKSGQGYYFMLNGIDFNTWQLKKYTSEGWQEVVKGEITNLTFQPEESYWLRVSANGPEIKLLFSGNGEDFTELAKVEDDTFMSGGVGVAVFDGYAFFDDFKVKN